MPARAITPEERLHNERMAADTKNREVSRAEVQLTNMQKSVGMLAELGWTKFKEQLGRVAFTCEWHDSYLNPTVAAPLTEAAGLTHKYGLDKRNAYTLIMDKTDGSEVEMLLKIESCDLGDAANAFKIIREYYMSRTQSSKNKAHRTFYNATMESTHTNIVTWSAKVLLLAADLEEVTEVVVPEESKLSVLLGGLLPEFEFINVQLDMAVNMTFAEARKLLIAFAQSKGIEKT